jgi:hypothetical protein
VLAKRELAKKLVEVPEVPVKVERVVRPLTLRVPVKLATLEIVWPFTKPEVIAPRVELPALSTVAKRLVDEAVVLKKLVEVAFEVVELIITRLLITLGKAEVEEAKIFMSCMAVVVPLVVVP